MKALNAALSRFTSPDIDDETKLERCNDLEDTSKPITDWVKRTWRVTPDPTHREILQALSDCVAALNRSARLKLGTSGDSTDLKHQHDQVRNAWNEATLSAGRGQAATDFRTQPSLFDAEPEQIKQWFNRQRARPGYTELKKEIERSVNSICNAPPSCHHSVNYSNKARVVMQETVRAGRILLAASEGEITDHARDSTVFDREDQYANKLVTFLGGIRTLLRIDPQRVLSEISDFPWTSPDFERAQDDARGTGDDLRLKFRSYEDQTSLRPATSNPQTSEEPRKTANAREEEIRARLQDPNIPQSHSRPSVASMLLMGGTVAGLLGAWAYHANE